jgi:hypothetical protein
MISHRRWQRQVLILAFGILPNVILLLPVRALACAGQLASCAAAVCCQSDNTCSPGSVCLINTFTWGCTADSDCISGNCNIPIGLCEQSTSPGQLCQSDIDCGQPVVTTGGTTGGAPLNPYPMYCVGGTCKSAAGDSCLNGSGVNCDTGSCGSLVCNYGGAGSTCGVATDCTALSGYTPECISGTCYWQVGSDCPTAHPSSCATGVCAGGGATGTCSCSGNGLPCGSNGDCCNFAAGLDQCVGGVCLRVPAKTCSTVGSIWCVGDTNPGETEGQNCTGAGTTCSNAALPLLSYCNSDTQCAPDYTCVNFGEREEQYGRCYVSTNQSCGSSVACLTGKCEGTSPKCACGGSNALTDWSPCAADADCCTGNECYGNICYAATGTACASDDNCLSAQCTVGVDTCACSAPGSGCEYTSDCCSAPAHSTKYCQNGGCEWCVSNTQNCSSAAECCSGSCPSGTCQCVGTGNACPIDGAPGCCTGNCNAATGLCST